MSWGGPAAGSAYQPHQPPPFANGQPGYSQPQPYQYGQQQNFGQFQGGPSYPPSGPPQRPPDNRPPKKKGNPIITRYPPPPGYRGPAQPQGPYGSNQYQNHYPPPQQGYPPGYSAPPNYPAQGYSAPPSYPPNQGYPAQNYGPPQGYPPQSGYPQQGYPPAQNYQYPQQGYPQAQPYSQPPSYPSGPSYTPQPTTYQGYPPQPAPSDPNQQGYHTNSQAPYPPPDSYNSYGSSSQDPNATPTPTSAHTATTQQTPTTAHPDSAISDKGEKPQLFLAWDDWDFDFDGAIWPKSNEPIDPNLSLGVIIWRPAKQVTRALPSTYEEAEEQALKPPAEKLGNGESVSIYFTLENSHEAFLDVRQTDEWHKIKNDPIFVVFPAENDMDLIPLDECIAKRTRPDEPLDETKVDDDEEMGDSNWNVMDNLEQALSGQSENMKPSAPVKEQESNRNQKQEDILAMLGVTGSPKPPSEEPMPFPFPAVDEKPLTSLPEKPPVPSVPQIPSRPEPPNPPQRAHSYGGHRNSTYGPPPQRPYGSLSASAHKRPPPPPPDQQEYDPWNPKAAQHLPHGHALDGSRESPARSEGSNNTLAGSDFETDKPANGANLAQTPTSAPQSVPKLERSDSSFSRKRSYDDTDQADEKLRQQDDHTKRKRRSQVDAAYSRR